VRSGGDYDAIIAMQIYQLYRKPSCKKPSKPLCLSVSKIFSARRSRTPIPSHPILSLSCHASPYTALTFKIDQASDTVMMIITTSHATIKKIAKIDTVTPTK